MQFLSRSRRTVAERYKIDKKKKSDVEYVGDMIKLMRSNDPEANKVRHFFHLSTAWQQILAAIQTNALRACTCLLVRRESDQ